jgi:hypothetical protein
MKNLIKTQLTAADWDKIDEGIQMIENALEGKTVALTEEERVKYGSINEQNKLLVNKVNDMRQNQPNLSSPDVDWNEFDSDFNSRSKFETRGQRLSSIVYRMQSTKILHDHDNFQDALDDYAYAQYKKGSGADGYAEKVAELKQFFNRSGSSNQNNPGNNP